MPDRRQQVSVIAQENLKLVIFLFHHCWRCTFDWEVTVVCEDTVHLLAGKKRLKMSIKIKTCCLRSTILIWQGQWRSSKKTFCHIKAYSPEISVWFCASYLSLYINSLSSIFMCCNCGVPHMSSPERTGWCQQFQQLSWVSGYAW